jgi:putative redox protein
MHANPGGMEVKGKAQETHQSDEENYHTELHEGCVEKVLMPPHSGPHTLAPNQEFSMRIEARLNRAHGSLTALNNGRHAWSADVGKTLGGGDLAPDPHDLLDSALAACTVLTLELYIRRKGMAVTDLQVFIERVEDKNEAGQPLYRLERRLKVEGALTNDERQRLLEIAGKCPIHRILEGETRVHTELLP